MSRTFEQLTDEILQLPIEERTLLADRLAESLGRHEEEIQRLWVEEARRRLEDFRSGKEQGIPAEEVMKEVRRIIGS